ncbi:hypothetical protein [Kaistella antarctica]|uniref:Uncharacterized protein n=1 Tax=Kaistella antarctica TaxID=266748 RepID=A0ABR4TYD5_9FLAO|nr:hypothetical protein [Kaistella antarctica]KEY18960.1 hypothetical protein HY04_10915 [Kaistella antarctica]
MKIAIRKVKMIRGAYSKRALKGMQPLVVTGSGHSVDNAVDAAIGKMRSSLDSMKGRLKDF